MQSVALAIIKDDRRPVDISGLAMEISAGEAIWLDIQLPFIPEEILVAAHRGHKLNMAIFTFSSRHRRQRAGYGMTAAIPD